jgi:hypothetical protein
VAAVGSQIEVWMDGGIRSGQDVLKAWALGARGTMIGRAMVYGLGAMGEAGVTKALQIIHKELDITMAFCGHTDIRQRGPRNPAARHLLSALASIGWLTAAALRPAVDVRTLGLVEVFFSYLVSRQFFQERMSVREGTGLVLVLAGVLAAVCTSDVASGQHRQGPLTHRNMCRAGRGAIAVGGGIASRTHRRNRSMKTTNLLRASSVALLVAGALAAPLAVQAQEGPWLVRVRAVNLDPRNSDSTGLGLGINNKTIPEVDISYFFTPNIAAELVLTVPQKQTVSSNGVAIGSLRHLPPTLTLQYHFTDLGDQALCRRRHQLHQVHQRAVHAGCRRGTEPDAQQRQRRLCTAGRR